MADDYDHSAEVPEVQRQRCREKTARGNACLTRAEAKKVARATRRNCGSKWVRAFRCAACGKFHTGKRRRRDERGRLEPPGPRED